MCVAWIWIGDRKGAIVVSPHQGAKDGPIQPYPTPRPHGRGPDRPLLPHRRRLPTPQPPRPTLRVPQEVVGFGSHRARALPATSRGGERALFPARHREVLLAPVPRGGGTSSFLVPSANEEAQALFGTSATGDPLRDDRRPGDVACRLYAASGIASQAGSPELGLLRGGGVGSGSEWRSPSPA